MPDRVTISTFQLMKMFPDAESARLYFERKAVAKVARRREGRDAAQAAFDNRHED